MNRNGKLLRVAVLAVLVFALAVVSTGTMAQQPEGDVESIACGDNVSCNRSGWAARISNSGGGGVFLAEQDAYTVAIKGRGRPGVYGTSGAGIGVKGNSTNGAGVWGFSEYDDGVYGKSNDEAGVQGRSLTTGAADNGVEGWTESENSTGEAGVYGENLGVDPGGSGPGVYGVGNALDTGYGVRARAYNATAVYGNSDSADYSHYGGFFSGPQGLFVQSESTSADAIDSRCNTGGNCVGLEVNSDTYIGVRSDTDRADNNWGLYTTDNVTALNYYWTKGAATFAQNGGSVDLEVGDLVVVTGMTAPLPDTDVPLLVVARADAASATAIVGVVQTAMHIEVVPRPEVRFNLTEIPDEEGGEPDYVYLPEEYESQETVYSGFEGPAAPGGHMGLTVAGMALVKADASAGAIQVGDLLTAGEGGIAVKAQQVGAEGQTAYQAGTLLGKAVEPLAEGQGLIWVLVDLR